MEGAGEFRAPDRDSLQFVARKQFLEALEEGAPEVVLALHRDVFPVFRETWFRTSPAFSDQDRFEEPPDPSAEEWETVPSWISMRFSRGDWAGAGPPLSDLAAALETWAGEYHLNEPWLLDTVLRTLRYWLGGKWAGRRTPEEIHEGLPGLFAEPLFVDSAAPPTFSVVGWVVTWESEEAFRARASEALDRYVTALREASEDAGFEPIPTFRASRHGPPLQRDLDWLVQYQVKRKSYQVIADESQVGNPGQLHFDHTGRGTVEKGVKKVATLVGLHLRTRKTGGG